MCISYGELSDAQLLHIYGFVETRSEGAGATNPHNFVCIQTSSLIDACQVCTYHTFHKGLELGAVLSLMKLAPPTPTTLCASRCSRSSTPAR